MTLAAGSRLGPYEILSPLGAGGMGEVYRARDTRLERTVAIKVLPTHLSSSPESRQRFEREAKTISQLSHPHICALHDVGREGDTEYLVMEYLEGETVAERLLKGPLPLEQTLRYGIQIADALDKAHRQGVVHRDLKPGNVMITKSGVKLLDFGLAKAMAPASQQSSLTALPTQMNLTQEGTILGTFQYMAPEQLEGKDADARTDIFAFGCVLYEMATGKKAFSGATQASLISSILRDEPQPISQVQPMSPPTLDRVVKTCLAKDPDDRWQSAGDVGKQLQWMPDASSTVVASRGVRSKRRVVAGTAAAIAALALLGGVLLSSRFRRAEKPQALSRFVIAPPRGYLYNDTASLSPDGRNVALILQDSAGRASVWVRALDELASRRVPGTENAHHTFWSPDGRELAFFSEGKLRRVGARGGPVQTICDSDTGFAGDWTPQGTILFTRQFGSGIVAVPASGGKPRSVTTPDAARGDIAHFFPTFLPDGRHFLFVARNLDPEKTSIMVGSLDSKEVQPLFHADSAAIFAEPGYVLFARDSALVAWRFDPDRLRMVGEPVPVLENVRYGTEDNRLPVSAAQGRLAYLLWYQLKRLTWIDRKGHDLGTVGPVGGYEDLRISPDGRRVAVAMRDSTHGQNLDVWVVDTDRGTTSRLSSGRTDEFSPTWFPDGQRLAYVSDHDGYYNLYERPANGGPEKPLIRSEKDKIHPSVSSDGRQLVYDLSVGANYARFLLPLSSPGNPRRLSVPSRFSEDHPEISPDGRWTAFDSDESGEREVYVEPLSGGQKRQISVHGGEMPIWRRDGLELFYRALNGTLMAIAFRSSEPGLVVGEPRPLFSMPLELSGYHAFRRPYDVSPDGQRFLAIRRAPEADPDDLVVVFDWTAALKKER
jgi:eukaryotic-like serine/threonine-protein kinase